MGVCRARRLCPESCVVRDRVQSAQDARGSPGPSRRDWESQEGSSLERSQGDFGKALHDLESTVQMLDAIVRSCFLRVCLEGLADSARRLHKRLLVLCL